MTFTPAMAAKANRLSIPAKPSLPVAAGTGSSTEPPPIRRLRQPRLPNRVTSDGHGRVRVSWGWPATRPG